ncbi:MAG: universal stress protein [Microcoleaceae cyanobacterium MO_207.B10]|nr:universal stress protein [Microcoleaceae cyanobacterium MO_207.B10]
MALKTIILALENSPSDLELIIYVVTELQLKLETTVVLSHVVATENNDLDNLADRPQIDVEEIPYLAIEKQLKLYQEKFPCQTKLEIIVGDPSEEIIRLSNIYNADLIVIGSRGLKGINRILKGSVSSQVVPEATCSVLVVKPRL